MTPLTEQQAEILAKFVKKGAADVEYLGKSLPSMRSALIELGASDEDADAVKAFAKQLRAVVQEHTEYLG